MTQLRNIGQLRRLRAKLARGGPELEARIAKRVAEAFTGLAREAFDARTSVDGTPWGNGADGKPITLQKSGDLREAATRFEAIGTRVRVSIAAVKHSRYQLRFRFIPALGEPLPRAWEDQLRQIAREEMQRYFAEVA